MKHYLILQAAKKRNNFINIAPFAINFKNAISRFEIPATDLSRAQKFYETVFSTQLLPIDLTNIKMRMFPLQDMTGIGRAVVNSGGFHTPHQQVPAT